MEEKEEPDFDGPPRAPHSCHAYQLMEHAEAMLKEGDRLQASEKAYGAYRHQLKALNEERGWNYRGRDGLFRLKNHVADLAQKELGISDDRIQKLIFASENLHYNFYKDTRPLDEIQNGIKFTKELIDILRQLGGNGNGTPSGHGNGAPSGSENDGEGGSSQPPQSSGHGSGTPSGSENDGEGGSSQPPPPSARRNGAASVGKSHLTPQMSPHMRQAKKLRKKFSERIGEESSIPLVGPGDFAFMSQAEFDALQDF